MDASRLTFSSSTATTARTPMVPMWLSRMISSTRSRGRELRRPSAVSARPSMCSPAERAHQHQHRDDARREERQDVVQTEDDRRPPLPPMSTPTMGKKTGAPRSSFSPPHQPAGTRTGVRKVRAEKKDFMRRRRGSRWQPAR